MVRAAGGGGLCEAAKWLAPLSLFAFASWHVILMHQETLPGVACPPRVKCPKEDLVAVLPVDARGSASAPTSKTRLPLAVPAGKLQPTGARRPAFDVIALIMSTGSPNDRRRMDVADETWLKKSMPGMTFKYFYALCHDEPAVQCKSGTPGCIRDRKHVTILPCKHGYKFLTSKSIEGYRYISATFEFKYVFKVDVDSLLDLSCLETSIRNLPEKCPSFGMGLWRVAGDSKVFSGEGNTKYDNTAYREDTGAEGYPPYMTGWALLWSADVVRFLGMAGLSGMPRWRNTWTIDDAAIGTFVLGLDLCHLSMTCPVWTEQSGDEMENVWSMLHDKDKVIEVSDGNAVKGYDGPFDDDVPNLGDLYNLQSKSLGHCAALCSSNPQCRSFEFSTTAGAGWDDPIKNCQLASGTNRAGAKWRDFALYIRH